MGHIYKKKYKNKDGEAYEGNIWWIKYYRTGKPFRESSKSSKKVVAEKLLKRREVHIEEGRFTGLRVEKILINELAEDLINDYKVSEKNLSEG